MRTTYTEVQINDTCNKCRVIINEPELCPCCKHSVKPTILHKQIIFNNCEIPYFYATYLCTHCYQCFICKFSEHTINKQTYTVYSFTKLETISPNIFNVENFDEFINDISPDFVKIYNQALEAEHYNLTEISGIGYRKALEFLIKDFLIKHENKEITKVENTALGACIDTMINNPQLKIAASRATWLGNDQTHYVQKYTDKDITDLKKLIKLSVHWIDMICLTDETEQISKK